MLGYSREEEQEAVGDFDLNPQGKRRGAAEPVLEPKKEANGQKIKQIFEKHGEESQQRQGVRDQGGGGSVRVRFLRGRKGQMHEERYCVSDQSSERAWGKC